MKNRRVARYVSTDRFRQSAPDPPLRLRDPVDVLAAMPFLLGYHPTDSLVVVGVHRHLHRMSIRYDLPPLGADVAGVPAPRTSAIRSRCCASRACPPCCWSATASRSGWPSPCSGCTGPTGAVGCHVLEALHTFAGRYRSALCADPDCCPAEGRPFEPRDTRVAAECTVAGRVALPDRDAYEAQLRPVGGPARQAMRAAATIADERLFAMLTHPPSVGTVERDRADRRDAPRSLEAEAAAPRRRAARRRRDGLARDPVARDRGPRHRLGAHHRRSGPDADPARHCGWTCRAGASRTSASLHCVCSRSPPGAAGTGRSPGWRWRRRWTWIRRTGWPPTCSTRWSRAGCRRRPCAGFPWRVFTPRPGSRPRRRSWSRRAGSRPA